MNEVDQWTNKQHTENRKNSFNRYCYNVTQIPAIK